MRPRDAASPPASDISEQLNPLHMNRITDFLDLVSLLLEPCPHIFTSCTAGPSRHTYIVPVRWSLLFWATVI